MFLMRVIQICHLKHPKNSNFLVFDIFRLKNLIFLFDFFLHVAECFLIFFFFWSCSTHIKAHIKAEIGFWVFLDFSEFDLEKTLLVYKLQYSYIQIKLKSSDRKYQAEQDAIRNNYRIYHYLILFSKTKFKHFYKSNLLSLIFSIRWHKFQLYIWIHFHCKWWQTYIFYLQL